MLKAAPSLALALTLAQAALITLIPAIPAPAGAADREDHAKRLFLRAKDLLRKGELAKAAGLFEQAIAKDLTEVAAMRQLGRVREKLGEYDLAVEAYRQYVEMVPSAPDAYAVRQAIKRCSAARAKQLQDTGGRAVSRKDLEIPRGMRPGSRKARAEARRRYDRARALNDNSDAEEKLYREAGALDPAFAEAWYNLGILYLMRSDAERAIWAHRRYAALQPDNHEAHFLLGVDHQVRGDLKAAAAAYRRSLARHPTHFDSLNNLAVVLEKQGDREGAMQHYRQAISAAPPGRGVRARYNLGDLYLSGGRFDDAIREFQTVLGAEEASRNPEGGTRIPAVPTKLRAQTHNALGKAYESQARIADAVGAYTAALALDPELSQARSNLVRARARMR